METPITKRLHISGLTPALSPAEISQRLSSFGTVKSLDGFGLLNGLNQPRKFGYVTIETTVGKLAKCMNVLSGSTWKGAKLRIGEAKPDYKERLAHEKAQTESHPPKKMPRHARGVEAADMSIVTPEIAVHRKGWRVTPLGRVIRPMRMRPVRPLPNLDGSGMEKDRVQKRKRRVKAPITRSRRRTIDPTRWKSVYLKGLFLDVDGVPGSATRGRSIANEGSTRDVISEDIAKSTDHGITIPFPATSGRITAATPMVPSSSASLPTQSLDDYTDLTLEKNRSMALLQSLFGDNENEDWIGKESVGSDVDEMLEKERDQFESVVEGIASENVDAEMDNSEQLGPEGSQKKKLKDLFAPEESGATFSLLGHLDLDLELDDEFIAQTFTKTHPTSPNLPSNLVDKPTSASASASHLTQINLDPKQPLFFPRGSSIGDAPTKGQIKDVFDVVIKNGWSWRDPAVGFWRTQAEEDIRKRWDEAKVELTRDWKRRWREAGKMKKRRGGGGDLD